MSSVKIKRALLSVSDKNNIIELAQGLQKLNIEIISTGGTAKLLKNNNIKVNTIESITDFPEIMNGRVKTLHPKIHGGILGLRDKHKSEAEKHNIPWIDLVICNLYPFENKPGIENIDIGGPTMLRASAKNFEFVGSVCDPDDYQEILNQLNQSGELSLDYKKYLASKTFSHTAKYDSLIASYFNQEAYPDTLTLAYKKIDNLRYGENPHQSAAVYKKLGEDSVLLNSEQLQGKQLSFNNINDTNGALNCLAEFSDPCCVVVKHANPCGVALSDDITSAFINSFEADSKSAFGGIIALNRPCTKAIAEYCEKIFLEVIIAPDFEPDALDILKNKSNLRLLKTKSTLSQQKINYKPIQSGLLIQDYDFQSLEPNHLEFVTKTQAPNNQFDTLCFGWKVAKHIKSNGILIAKDNTTLGIGGGQVSRVDAVDIALSKSDIDLTNAVLISDGFFPFRDSIDKIAKSGIKTILQPGGSMRDEEVIAACNEHGIAMAFTNKRCFNH